MTGIPSAPSAPPPPPNPSVNGIQQAQDSTGLPPQNEVHQPQQVQPYNPVQPQSTSHYIHPQPPAQPQAYPQQPQYQPQAPPQYVSYQTAQPPPTSSASYAPSTTPQTSQQMPPSSIPESAQKAVNMANASQGPTYPMPVHTPNAPTAQTSNVVIVNSGGDKPQGMAIVEPTGGNWPAFWIGLLMGFLLQLFALFFLCCSDDTCLGLRGKRRVYYGSGVATGIVLNFILAAIIIAATR